MSTRAAADGFGRPGVPGAGTRCAASAARGAPGGERRGRRRAAVGRGLSIRFGPVLLMAVLALPLGVCAATTVEFQSASSSVAESAGTASLTVQLSATSADTISVHYATADGTATAGSDYTATSGTLSFAPGETSMSITVTIVNDALAEGAETLSVTLSSPSNAVLGVQSVHTLTITDDEDTDADGLPDAWEQQIVDANGTDGIATIAQVLPGDDFDGDGFTNAQEYAAGTTPTDPLSGPDTVFTTADSGSGSLRAAMAFANAHPGTTIRFHIPGDGVHTIQPTSALPTLTVPVTIDGYTQPGSRANTLATGNDAVLLIEVDGSQTGSGYGLTIAGGGSTVRGLVVNGARSAGIALITFGGNTVEGCFLGTNATGTAAVPNATSGIGIDGPDNVIGGTTPASRNLLSGNPYHGVHIGGVAAQRNRVEGNYIGTNAAGTAAVGNGWNGVLIEGAPDNTVGGLTAGARNVISGNEVNGVEATGAGGTGNRIQGNYIGTNAAGTAAVPNRYYGGIRDLVPDLLIGGTEPGAGNLVSGNAQSGIQTSGAPTIQGNLIGTDLTGTVAVPNGTGVSTFGNGGLIGGTTAAARNVISGNAGGIGVQGSGVRIQGNYIGPDITGVVTLVNTDIGVAVFGIGDKADNVIGGTNPGEGNVISGNGSHGVFMHVAAVRTVVVGNLIGLGSDGTTALGNGGDGVGMRPGRGAVVGGTTAAARNIISCNAGCGVVTSLPGGVAGDNQILGNYIGTDVTGTLARGNGSGGVCLAEGNYGNQVGGTQAGAGNRIAYNGGPGVLVNRSPGNPIRGNAIYANTGLGIDLEPDGVTPNDAGDTDTGANNLQNFPVIQVVYASASSVVICGTLDTPNPQTCAVDPFRNDTRDPSNYGEGQVFLGSGTPTASGTFMVALPVAVAVGTWISATATDADGNTSEFSLCVAATASDNDGLPDDWEWTHWSNLGQAPGDDFDGDGFTNAQECAVGTDPTRANSAPAYSWTTIVGQPGGPGNADGTGRAARFSSPDSVAVDGTGNVYVADRDNHTIRRVTPTGVVTTLAGSPGQWGSADGTGSSARFCSPRGIAVDGAGNLVVGDTGNGIIRKVTPAGVVTTLAGLAGAAGTVDGTGSAARFYNPSGVSVDSAGNVFVAEYSGSHTIRKVTPAGVVTTLAGSPGLAGSADGTGSDARFNGPFAVAVDSAGNLFVADVHNHTIRRVTPAGVVTTLAGSPGSGGATDGTGAAAGFSYPSGVSVDSAGNVFVADSGNATIRKVTPAGVVTTLAGSPGSGGSADGTGSTARFGGPNAVAVDSAGNVFVADVGNHTIRKVTPAGVVTTLAGLAGGGSGSADGTGSTARLSDPRGVAVDSAGDLFVADTGNDTIRKVTPAGTVTTLAGSAGVAGSDDGTGSAARFHDPVAVAVDAAGNALVADTDNHTIRRVTPAGVVTTLAGLAGVSGSADGTGSDARFNYPYGVAVDGAGNVIVADTLNDTIRKVTPAGVVTTLAGLPGAPGSADGTGSAARFSSPRGMAVDSAGNLFVADMGNSTLRKVAPAGVVTTLAGGGVPGVDGTGAAAGFYLPEGVAVDSGGNVFVADTENHTIRKVTPAGVVTTIGGTAGVYGGGDGIGRAAIFAAPWGIAVDSAGSLYVTDEGNNRISRGTLVYPPPLVQFQTAASSVAETAGTVTLTVTLSGTSPNPITVAYATAPSTGSGSATAGEDYTAASGTLTFAPGETSRTISITIIDDTAFEGPETLQITLSDPTNVIPGSATVHTLTILDDEDSDNDGLPDAWEWLWWGSLDSDPDSDPDSDGFTNAQEYAVGTDPTRADSAPVYSWTNFVGQPGGPDATDGTGGVVRFNQPQDVAVDTAGNVFVAARYDHVIQKVTPTGVVTVLAGSPGNPGSADGTGSAARFSQPLGVALDSVGNLFVADCGNHTIRRVTPAGVVTALAGSPGDPGSADGTGSAARFRSPTGVAVDHAGNVVVADYDNHTIRKVTPAGVVTTLAGSARAQGSADGTGSAARFDWPSGVAVDGAGNVVVADYTNNTIRRVTPAGVVTTLAGSPQDLREADGTGSEARFAHPYDVAVDSAGNIFVADYYGATIRKVTPAGVVTTVAGGQGGSADGTGRDARFNGPFGLAMDSEGTLFVADSRNGTIRKVTPAGVVTTLTGRAGYAGGAARFHLPSGAAVDSAGNVLVGDALNHVIRKVTPAGLVTTLAGSLGYPGSADGTGSAARFSAPCGVALDSVGDLVVADCWNHTIRKVTPAGVVTTLAGSPGDAGSTDGTGSAARFNRPVDVAVDSAGTVFVADLYNQTIRKVTSAGVVTTLAGSPGNHGSDDGTGSAARFDSPWGVAVDSTGNVFVADGGQNHTIRKVTPEGVVTTLAGSAGNAGHDDGTGSTARFWNPTDVAVDSAGNILVLEANDGGTRKVTPAGVVTTLPSIGHSGASRVAVDSEGNVFVADYGNSRVRKLTPAGVVTTLVGGAENRGDADGTGSAARFWNPVGVAVDSTGNVLVADAWNRTVRKATPAGVVTTLAGPGSAWPPASVDGTGTAACFHHPTGMAVDGAGNAFVADNVTHTLRKVTPDGVVTTLAGLAGSPGSANGTGSAARFNQPRGVAVDSAGSIFVADNGNHTIRKVTSAGVVTTLAGSAGNSGTADGTGSAARFSSPTGVAVDSAGSVFVADHGNHTLRKVTPAGLVTTVAGSPGSPGEADGTGSAARFFYPTGVSVDGAGNVFVADAWNNTIRMVTAAGVVTTIGGTPGLVGAADGVGPAAGFSNPSGIAVAGDGTLLVADADNNRLSRGTLIYPPPLIQFEVAATSVLETAGEIVVTVTLSGPSPNPITLDYTTVDGGATAGSDYTATSGTLTFAPGQTTATITIPIANDADAEPSETFTLVFSDPTQAALGAEAQLTLTLVDTVLTVTAPIGGERWRQGMTRAITWTSSGDSVANVKIELRRGGVLDRVLVASTPNTGSWDWTLPIDLEGALDYRVRVSSAATPAIAGSSAGDCPFAADPYTFQHDPQHSGRSPFTGPAAPVLKWTFAMTGGTSSSPALGPDGTIYCGSNDGSVYAVNPDGTRKWAFATGDAVGASPALGTDGTVYCGSADHKVYALHPDGTQKWAFTTGDVVYSSAAVGADGTVYVGSWDGHLYALRSDGTLRWAFAAGPAGVTRLRVSSPALGADGTIYAGTADWDVGGALFAVNPDGTQKWSFTTGGTDSPPTVAPDGTIYAGSRSATGDVGVGVLFAVNPDGTEKWRFATAGALGSTPALGADGTIYYSATATLYALNPDGTQKWAVPGGGSGYWTGSPAVDADGTIYVAGGNWTITALRPDGTEKCGIVIDGTGHISSSPALGADGRIYLGGWDASTSSLYAVGNQPPPSVAGSTPPDGALVTALPSLRLDLAYYTDVDEADSTVVITRDGAAYTAFSRDDSVEKRITLSFQPAAGVGLYAITVTPVDMVGRAGTPVTIWIRVVAALGQNVFYVDAAAPAGRTPALAFDPATPVRALTTLLTSPYVVAGDTVRVAAGTYSSTATGETFPLLVCDGLTLTGAGLASTTLDAGGSGRVINLGGGSVSGFTITGGSAADGAGVGITGSSVRLTHCRIVGNTATGAGGGVLVEGGPAVLGNNLIELNSAAAGGALAIRAGATATVLANTIVRNQGGAVLLDGCAPATRLADNLLAWNGGTAIVESHAASDAVVEFNLFWANGGVYRDEGATDYAGVAQAQAAVPQLTHNLEADPRLADTDGPDHDPLTWQDNDWHLTDLSPCLNAGIATPLLSATDLDGDGRILDGVPDIGADERSTGSGLVDVVVPATDEVTDDLSVFRVSDGARLADLALAISGNRPIAVARAGADRVWVGNDYADTVTRLDGAGHDTVTAWTTGAYYSRGICVDAEGNAWVTHYYSQAVTKLTPAGAVAAGFPAAVGRYPVGIAVGRAGDIWVAEEGDNTVRRLSATGATLASIPVAGKPQYLAVDRRGRVWVTCANDNVVRRLDAAGAAAGTFAVGGQPTGIAVDLYGNVWVSNTGSANVTKLDEDGAPQLGGPVVVGAQPRGIAGDAAGFVWVVLSGADQVVRLAQDGTITARHAVAGGPYAYGDLAGLAFAAVVRDASPPSVPGTPAGPGAVSRLVPVRFTWTAATEPDGGLAGYDLQAGTSPGAADRYDGFVGNVLAWDVTAAHGETLYARVRARNPSGVTGPWSANSAGVHVDTEGPTLVSRSPTADWVTSLVSLTLALTDDRGVGAVDMPATLASLVVRRNGTVLTSGQTYQVADQGGGSLQILLTPPANGLCEVELAAVDDAGNERLIRQVVYDDNGASPTVGTVSPADGAVGVPADASVVITFSEPVAPASITAASVAVTANAQPVPGTLEVAYNQVTFRPTGGFAPGVTCTLTITAAVTDPGDHGLAAAPVVRSFTTGVASLSVQAVAVDESNGTVTVTVTLVGLSAEPVRVHYATSDTTAMAGSDYTAASGDLQWAANQNGPKTFTVALLEDDLDEPDEEFTITLSAPENAAIAVPQARITVRDNDPTPTLTVTGTTVNEGVPGGTVAVTVTLSGRSQSAVSVGYTTADGSPSTGSGPGGATAERDYQAAAGTLTWGPGQTGAQTVVVPLVDDAEDEPDESVLVQLLDPVAASLAVAQAQVTIIDNDSPPTVSFLLATQTVPESAGTVPVTVVLSAASGYAVSVPFTVGGTASVPDDHDLVAGDVTVPAGQTQASIRIHVVDDVIDEPDESVVVTLGQASHAQVVPPATYTLWAVDGTVTLTVDSAWGTATPAPGAHVCASGTTVEATVTGSPVADGAGRRHLLSGWTGTGSVPAAGSGASTGAFVLTQGSELAWTWTTQYRLDASAGAGGSVAVDLPGQDGWYDEGAAVRLTATPGVFVLPRCFDRWSGDVPAGHETDNPLTVTMTQARTVQAVFVDNDEDGDLMADDWEVFHFGGHADPLADADHDGFNNYSEFVGGSDPRDPTSPTGFGGGRYVDTTTGHAYRYVAGALTWDQAEERCELVGGHLATVSGEAENSVVYGRISAGVTYSWIGGSDRVGTWRWVTYPAESWTFDKWRSNEPSAVAGYDYTGMAGPAELTTNRSKWSSLLETDGRIAGYVCEWDYAGDLDADGLPDTWEMRWFGNLLEGGSDDSESEAAGGPDGLSNADEYALGTDPTARTQTYRVTTSVVAGPAGSRVDGGGVKPAGTNVTLTAVLGASPYTYAVDEWRGAVAGGGTELLQDGGSTYSITGIARDYTIELHFACTGGAPTPNPLTWAVEPVAMADPQGRFAITMSVAEASHPLGVEYGFEETSGTNRTSGWIPGRTWECSGLTPNTLYTFQARARCGGGALTASGWTPSRTARTLTPGLPTLTFTDPDGLYDFPVDGFFTFRWTATSDLPAGSTVSLYLDNDTATLEKRITVREGLAFSNTSYAFSTAPLADGARWYVWAEVSDGSGLPGHVLSVASVYPFVVDNRTPTAMTCELLPVGTVTAVYGQSVQARAGVVLSGTTTPVPAGRIDFTFAGPVGQGGTVEGSAPLNGTSLKTYVPSGVGAWQVYASWPGTTGTPGYRPCASPPVPLQVTQGTATLELSAGTNPPLLVNQSRSFSGLLGIVTGNQGVSLLGQAVELLYRDPTAADRPPVTALCYTAAGHFTSAEYVFDRTGLWTVRVRFAGNTNLTAVESEAITVHVLEVPGYVILCQGKLPGNRPEGLDEHALTLATLYQACRDLGIGDDLIQYYTYKADAPGRDGEPSEAALRAAVTQWAQQRMNEAPGDLYIVLVNHGSVGAFHMDRDLLTPPELRDMLDTLQAGLSPAAQERSIIVVLGMCHSGSFVDELSGPQRIVVASCDTLEVSQRGARGAAGIRDGELFVSTLFGQLRSGQDLFNSFEAAALSTQEQALVTTPAAAQAGGAWVQDPYGLYHRVDYVIDNLDGTYTYRVTSRTDGTAPKGLVHLVFGIPEADRLGLTARSQYGLAATIPGTDTPTGVAGLRFTSGDFRLGDNRGQAESEWFEVRAPRLYATLTLAACVGTAGSSASQLSCQSTLSVPLAVFGAYETNGLYADASTQHALLDDNGDGQASHELSDMEGDGVGAMGVYLGVHTNAPAAMEVLAAAPPVFLGSSVTAEPLPDLWAEFDRAGGAISAVWVEVKPPTYEGPDGQGSMQYDMELPSYAASRYEDIDAFASRWAWATAPARAYDDSAFATPGAYQVFYFGQAAGEPEPAHGPYTWVFRASGTATPSAFGLLEPAVDASVASDTTFRWEASESPEGTVRYLFLLWSDSAGTALHDSGPLQSGTVILVDHTVLEDGEYWWEVRAVDPAGNARPRGGLRHVTVNHTNAGPPSFLKGLILDAATRLPLPTAEIQVEGQASQAWPGGGYVVGLQAGTYQVTCRAAGCQTQTRQVAVGANTIVQQDFLMALTGKLATVKLVAGWNLVSLPVEPYDPTVAGVFADPGTRGLVARGPVWGWDGTAYVAADTLEPLRGYWVYSLRAVVLSVAGEPVTDPTRHLLPGWNLVGPSLHWDVPVLPVSGTQPPWYGWDGGAAQYLAAARQPAPYDNLLKAAAGYWVYVDAGTDVQLGPAAR